MYLVLELPSFISHRRPQRHYWNSVFFFRTWFWNLFCIHILEDWRNIFYRMFYEGLHKFFSNSSYSVINLILPNSKQLLWHFFTNKQVDVLGDFNLEFWYILLFEVRFWIFRISFFAQNGDNSKGYPLENLKSHHLWFEKCFLITKCIKISVIKIISKLT